MITPKSQILSNPISTALQLPTFSFAFNLTSRTLGGVATIISKQMLNLTAQYLHHWKKATSSIFCCGNTFHRFVFEQTVIEKSTMSLFTTRVEEPFDTISNDTTLFRSYSSNWVFFFSFLLCLFCSVFAL